MNAFGLPRDWPSGQTRISIHLPTAVADRLNAATYKRAAIDHAVSAFLLELYCYVKHHNITLDSVAFDAAVRRLTNNQTDRQADRVDDSRGTYCSHCGASTNTEHGHYEGRTAESDDSKQVC